MVSPPNSAVDDEFSVPPMLRVLVKVEEAVESSPPWELMEKRVVEATFRTLRALPVALVSENCRERMSEALEVAATVSTDVEIGVDVPMPKWKLPVSLFK